LRRTLVGLRIKARPGGDQVLVVQEGPAERPHEEIVAQGKIPGDLPQAQIDAVVAVVAHDQGAAVAPGNEAVVLAPVDLHLVLVEGVHQVARHHALRQGIAVKGLQGEGRVGQSLDIGLADLEGLVIDDLLVLDQPAPDPGQGAEHLAVAIALDEAFRRYGVERRLQAGKAGEEIVERPVLGEDHHDRLNMVAQGLVGSRSVHGQRLCAWRGGVGTSRQRCEQAGEAKALDQLPPVGVCRLGLPRFIRLLRHINIPLRSKTLQPFAIKLRRHKTFIFHPNQGEASKNP